MKKLILLSGLLFSISLSFAQDAKESFKNGEKSFKLGQYKEAVDLFTKVIQADPHFKKVYASRAEAYIKMGKKEEAARDYEREAIENQKDEELYVKSAALFFEAENFQKSIEMCKKALEIKNKDKDAIYYNTKSNLALNNFEAALKEADKLVYLSSKTAEFLYLHGLANEGLKKFVEAEKDLADAQDQDKSNMEYPIALSRVRLVLGKYDNALQSANDALRLSPNNTRALLLRAKSYFRKDSFTESMTDLGKVIANEPNNKGAFYVRASVYEKLSQYQSAINDYTKISAIDNTDYEALYRKGLCFIEIQNNKSATQELEKVLEMTAKDDGLFEYRKKVEDKIWTINKESDLPTAEITSHQKHSDGSIIIKSGEKKLILKGTVSDASRIKSIKVNDVSAEFDEKAYNPEFTATLYEFSNSINIIAKDVYDNQVNKSFNLKVIESDAPVVSLVTPYASDNNDVFIDQASSAQLIEGKILDESSIKSITIDGVIASFNVNEMNPKFVANVDLNNKSSFTIKVVDQYDNVAEVKYTLNIGATAQSGSDNPMGKTWVVFLENTNYTAYPPLEGPTKDIGMMKGSLSNYNINNIIHKKNLTKSDFERFFNLELRDQLKNNNVKSLLVWYGGHGKFLNETGYWIPVDAKRNDEFTYYNVNNIKSAIQSYSSIEHILLISDACESGPGFYLTMRAAPKQKNCNNYADVKYKSAQVFTSAGTELASDNSQFSKTFSKTLDENPNACIAIDDIVDKVSAAVEQNSRQKPKFGKIKTIEDENGTFFFIKK